MASVIPVITTAIARARPSGRAREAAIRVAVGVMREAPAAVTARQMRRHQYAGAVADRALPATNSPSPISSVVRRGRDSVDIDSRGAKTA